MGQNRKIYTAEFKSKVAMEAIRGDETISNIAKKYEIHLENGTDRRCKRHL